MEERGLDKGFEGRERIAINDCWEGVPSISVNSHGFFYDLVSETLTDYLQKVKVIFWLHNVHYNTSGSSVELRTERPGFKFLLGHEAQVTLG